MTSRARRVAINGFGRIGRLLFRSAFSESMRSVLHFEIVAINDLGDIENLVYLLRRDTVYGVYEQNVAHDAKKGVLLVHGKEVKVFQVKDPAALPWKSLNVDIVVEATGAHESFEKARAHIESGATRVILTAPAKDAETSHAGTVLMGINEEKLASVVLSSNASCTTNAVSPVIQILSENPGMKKAVLNTTHAYTATQNIVDGPVKGKDFLRGRAAAQNIVPSSTGAAIALTRAIPSLEGKFDGIAVRVPVVAGSLADITFVAKRNVTAEEINATLRNAAAEPRWEGILSVSEEPLVSSDIVGAPYGAVVDLSFTKVIDGDLVKVLSWYDNEAGYVATLVRHVQAVAQSLSRHGR